MDFGLTPFTVHEADIAVFHAWEDGIAVAGPLDRHLQSGLVSAFRQSLTISRTSPHEGERAFADWRSSPLPHGVAWSIETSAPLSALTDGAPVSSWFTPGIPLVVLVRFLCSITGQWRLFQFTDASPADSSTAESAQTMLTGHKFHAGFMEEFKGSAAEPAPALVPRYLGVIEWRHLGRRIPCWYYNAETATWSETAENQIPLGEDTARYISLDQSDPDDVRLSYLAARTEPGTQAGLDATRIGWIDTPAFRITASTGLTFEPGWHLQTGCPEPITLPPSGRHWEHPRCVFRFGRRLYATLSHGVFAMPSFYADTTPDIPIDFPIRLSRLVLLPDAGYTLLT